MATVDLSSFTITVEDSTPIFKTRTESRTDISIYQTIQKEDVLEAVAHRDSSYQASFNRCTSTGCSDYTKGFNYIPSCGECEQPLFTPFTDAVYTCLADVLLQRIDYDIDNLISEDRDPNYGGGMPVVDNDVITGTTQYYYSDAYIEYKKYVDVLDPNIYGEYGWKDFPGSSGEVSYNKFFAMSGFWLGFEPCHGANRLYQCAVSCENGEVVGCWQVGDIQRETGQNPLSLYGEVQFGSVWSFNGFEAGTPTTKYYQIYDPAQIIASGLRLNKQQIVPLNPTLPINNFNPISLSEQTGYANCQTIRSSIDFGDADFLRESNCLSSSNKRDNDLRCTTCDPESYKPNRAIDKFLKFADITRNIDRPDSYYEEIRRTPTESIPKSEFQKLKFSIVGDITGKILTDGIDCYFPKSVTDETPGKFILGGATTATKEKGFKQATYTDLGLSPYYKYDDCILCLEAKANARFETVTGAVNDISLVSPFYDKCGIDFSGGTERLKYNIDCNCVRCGDVYITGAPRYQQASNSWGYEPWATDASSFKNIPQKNKVTAIVDGKPQIIDDPDCVPSDEQDPVLNPYYPYAKTKTPSCWDYNSGEYRRIWHFWDKSKTFTDFQFRYLPDNLEQYTRNTLWSGCGGLRGGDRAIVPFGITCYEKLRERQNASGERVVLPSLSIVTGVKYAAINEYTTGEVDAGVLPVDTLGRSGPRSYLYYSRRATTSYLPCDNTNLGTFLGTYKCSCEWLPCMDEVMIAVVPIKYGSDASTHYYQCQNLNAATAAFPGVFEMHLEGDKLMGEEARSINTLFPLVGPNNYTDGIITYPGIRVGLDWDSNTNPNLGPVNPEDQKGVGGANAYKLQSNYHNTYYLDYIEPTYFWNRPITYLNVPGIMKSHSGRTSADGTYFRLQRLHDAYHINCSSKTVSGTVIWGEFGYIPNTTNTLFPSLESSLPPIRGPVVPNTVGPNADDRGRT